MVVAVNAGDYPVTVELPRDENNNPQTWTILANHLETTADGIEDYSEAKITIHPRDSFVFGLKR